MKSIANIAKKSKIIEYLIVFAIVISLDMIFLIRYGFDISLQHLVIAVFNISIVLAIISFIQKNKRRYIAYAIYLTLIFVFFVTDSTLFFFKEDVTSVAMLLESFRDTMRVGLRYNPLAAYNIFIWSGIFLGFSFGLVTLSKIANLQEQTRRVGIIKSTIFLIFAMIGVVLSPNVLEKYEYLVFRNPADKIFFVQEFGSSTYHKKDIINFASNLIVPLFQASEYKEDITLDFTGEKAERSPFFGESKGDNVIMIMCETCEEYAFSRKHTPNYYRLLDKSISFDNFYSAAKSNYTYDAEFKALTSMMYFQADNYMHTFGDNQFNNALPHVLGEKGYTANAFHNFYRTFFNRDEIYYNMGFDNYYAPEELVLAEGQLWPLDSIMFETKKDLIAPIQEEPFFSFIITVTPHGPHDEFREELFQHYELLALDPEFKEAELELLTIKAAQMDFDIGLGILLDDLENKGLMENTIIVLFSDHKNYSSYEITQKYTPNSDVDFETDKVPFMIYANSLAPKISSILTSNYDIAPTIFDLLGISYIQDYYHGQSMFLLNRLDTPIILSYTTWISYESRVFRNEVIFGIDNAEYLLAKRMEIYDLIKIHEKMFQSDFFRDRQTFVTKE